MKTLVYVAGPYKGNDGSGGNIERAEEISLKLIREGYDVFTPHKNTAGYEKYTDIPKEHWYDMDLNILARCDMLFVMKGSELSIGVAKEIAFAEKHGIPIIHEAKTEEEGDILGALWPGGYRQ